MTSLEVITNTQVAATLANVALENNHPSLNSSISLLGDGETISTTSKRTHFKTKKNFQNGEKCYE
jgi:hypothetical protein